MPHDSSSQRRNLQRLYSKVRARFLLRLLAMIEPLKTTVRQADGEIGVPLTMKRICLLAAQMDGYAAN